MDKKDNPTPTEPEQNSTPSAESAVSDKSANAPTPPSIESITPQSSGPKSTVTESAAEPAIEGPKPATLPAKKPSSALPIVVAILTVILLIGIGIAAVKLSDNMVDENDQPQQNSSSTTPVEQSDLDQEIDDVNQTEKDLDAVDQELEENDITDENVGL